jgi:hypothetical protein
MRIWSHPETGQLYGNFTLANIAIIDIGKVRSGKLLLALASTVIFGTFDRRRIFGCFLLGPQRKHKKWNRYVYMFKICKLWLLVVSDTQT